MSQKPSTTRGRVAKRADQAAAQRGQSLVEFAVILPILFALVGVVIDASRLYLAWSSLEAATRDAAQYLATSSSDAYAVDHTWAGADADTKAEYIVEKTTGHGFAISPTGGTLADCSAGQVTTVYSTNTRWQDGGSVANPLSTAKVMTCLPFKTLFSYPFFTTDGAWLLSSEREITVIVGR